MNVAYAVSLHGDNFCQNIPLELQLDLFQQMLPLTTTRRSNCAAQADSDLTHHH